jgi:hypothetical protein
MLYWGAVLVEVSAVWLFVHGQPPWVVVGTILVGLSLLLVLDRILERGR